MKNNRDKLNDALGQVDESVVQDAVMYAESIRVTRAAREARLTLLRRRAAMVAAASLSMAFLAGAVLALPMLKRDNGDTPPVTMEPSDGEAAFYVEAPIVKVVQLSATETATISDPTIPVNQLETEVKETNVDFASFPLLVFDCRPGETVTIKADSDCLGYVDMVWDDNADWETKQEFAKKTYWLQHKYSEFKPQEGVVYYTDTLTVDPEVASVVVCTPYSDEEQREAIITFTVTNEEGQITGAGSFYVARRYLLNAEERALALGIPFVRRSAVLGSVRFNNPADVTEEQVNDLLDSFVARIDEVKETLDFSPVTRDEFNAYAKVEILRTLFAGQKIVGTGSSLGSWQDFTTFELTAQNDDKKEHNFILFGDGNWVEYRSHGDCNWADCHLGCPNQKEYGEHHAFTLGCRIRTYDGRVYELQTVSPDSERETFVLIRDKAE